MSQIKASDVKTLREMSGAGMMDCKKALVEVGGDIDQAVDYLRKKGLSAASKKSGRVAAEGIVAVLTEGDAGVVIEVNAETDFVSKNQKFLDFVQALSVLILKENPANLDALKALSFTEAETVEQALSQLIASIGENISIRRFACIRVPDGLVTGYVHGGGKIGVLLGIEGNSDALKELARGIAMHVAASNPLYIHRKDVPAEAVDRERTVLTERAAASGKPAHILDKIVSGQLNKFYAETCLLEQTFVMDTDKTVTQALSGVQQDAKITAMHRFHLGEGIEKAEEDFAAEVAAQIHG